jgi:hypothetical protein
MNIRPVGAELPHEDGRKERHDKANSHFSQFRERLTIELNTICFFGFQARKNVS